MVRPKNIKNIKPGSCTIVFDGLLCNRGAGVWELKTKGGGRKKLTAGEAAKHLPQPAPVKKR